MTVIRNETYKHGRRAEAYDSHGAYSAKNQFGGNNIGRTKEYGMQIGEKFFEFVSVHD